MFVSSFRFNNLEVVRSTPYTHPHSTSPFESAPSFPYY